MLKRITFYSLTHLGRLDKVLFDALTQRGQGAALVLGQLLAELLVAPLLGRVRLDIDQLLDNETRDASLFHNFVRLCDCFLNGVNTLIPM